MCIHIQTHTHAHTHDWEKILNKMFTGKGTCTLYIRLETQELSEQAHDQRNTDSKYTHRKILATFGQPENGKKFRRSHYTVTE